MENNKIYLTAEEAISLLPDGDNIHTFRENGVLMIGADWDREYIIGKIKESDHIEITGTYARSMNHGIAAYDEDSEFQMDVLFIETDKAKLDAFDPPKEA